MIQAIGLTSAARRNGVPVVDDLSFEAPPGKITGLLGGPGSGRSMALRLMLGLEPGRGTALFNGRPVHRIPRPAYEIGVLLGDPQGHPGRSARGHLRMLCAAEGIPAFRADEVLELVGLSGVSDERLDTFSPGMERRLGLAAALLGDPGTLLLDEPDAGLPAEEAAWLYSLLRSFADGGGTVVATGGNPGRMARFADRVITVERGRLVADQPATEFARTRLRPRIVVRSPQAPRLARLLAAEGIEVAKEGGSCVGIFGTDRAYVGETAFRHGIVLHELAEQVVDTGPPSPGAGDTPEAAGARPATGRAAPADRLADEDTAARGPFRTFGKRVGAPCGEPGDDDPGEHPDHRPPLPGPTRLLHYEWLRLTGIPSTWLVAGAALAADLAVTLVLGRGVFASLAGRPHEVQRALTAWPPGFPLPPVALGAGVLGALAFGHEFRYPALLTAQVAARRRMRLLLAKLTVTAVCGLCLAAASLAVNASLIRHAVAPPGWSMTEPLLPLLAWWGALAVGCGWTGLLAAGVFRSSLVGVLSVLAVPVLVEPAVDWVREHPASGPALTLLGKAAALLTGTWAYPPDRAVRAADRLASGPVTGALMVTIAALLCAYVFLAARRRSGGRSRRR